VTTTFAIAPQSTFSRGGCSFQYGRGSAPTIPQQVQTMRGPKAGTATSSGQRSALSTAWLVALPAIDGERPHAELAHVVERHRLDRLVEAGHQRSLPSGASSTARPSGVSTSLSAASRSTRPRTTICVTVAPVISARAHSVPLERQNSRMRCPHHSLRTEHLVSLVIATSSSNVTAANLIAHP
jgi:hypothetical protein